MKSLKPRVAKCRSCGLTQKASRSELAKRALCVACGSICDPLTPIEKPKRKGNRSATLK